MPVVGYVRVSTEDQAREGVSLAAQQAKLEAYAVVKDWML
jgi:DNA invertase Pin-like site-specific DNA recombinase